ncbi:MAG: hypothetical protein IT229_02710 [Flavobacteriales bacterium]|nr:hypothetical protein [Flavobacteriales bacterium]
MGIEVFPVRTQAELRAFIRLPAVLPGRRPNYVPPIWGEERRWHDPEKNPALRDQSSIRFLARSNGQLVGRIMGLVHRGYNASHNERTARFYQLDAVDDQEVVRVLLSKAEVWAREQGMDRIIGPFGLSDKDPQGLQVEGFEHLPVIATPTNPAYLPLLVEACGYAKHADCVAYRLAVPNTVPERYERVALHVLRSEGLTVKTFKDRGALKRWIVPVLELVNNTYTDLLGFVPMSRAEMQKLATDYLPLLDPELVVVVVDLHEVPVAFVVAVPDLSPGLQRAKGRLFPFGFLHILRSIRSSKQLDLLLGAVRQDLQGRGLTGALGVHLFGVARRRGFTIIDSHLVLESNQKMRAQMERLGGESYKRFRIYGKAL